MPIFEYVCSECARQFELIVQTSTIPECPKCGSRQLEKQLSTFAVSSGGHLTSAGGGGHHHGPGGGGGCGRCSGPGGCQS